MKKNVTYIVSDVDKAIAFEWIVQHINRDKINLTFILINCEKSYLSQFLIENKVPVFHISCQSYKKILFAIWKCFFILKKVKSELIHCHLIKANLIGLTAAKLANIKSRIYTRHHSDFHHIYHKKAVKLDKYCNRIATKVVSISDVVTDVLINDEKLSESKIIKIWHGFDTQKFMNYDVEKVYNLKNKYNPKEKKMVIGVISRATHWKGIQYIIPAFKLVLEEYPDALLLLFNPFGEYEKEIDILLEEIPTESFQKVFFEYDIVNLYKIFDVFVHVPISVSVEAFGQTYVECMLSKVPLIATRSGIGNEIMVDEVNCLEVPYENSGLIFKAIKRVVEDIQLRESMVNHAQLNVKEKFSVINMINSLEELYLH
ncbi:MAG: glycosyltransferase family 4 protein [Bacteroidota bacterium]